MSTNTISTETEWARSGTRFYPSKRADMSAKLIGGVYRFVQPVQAPWFLDRVAAKFEFPFKVYDASTDIIDRILNYWKTNGGNLGVLMNGLRGAGKTMTAQQVANRLIKEKNLPVLVVKHPVPLQTIFDDVQQDMMVIFDEFEKTHNEDQHPGVQQSLLSTIDGMSRSSHNRLIIFTTNSTRINENFRDRPSRIHYKFEFQRVADEIIEGLIRDSLPEELQHFKSDIFEFLHTRSICTIDIVKAVIAEVRTFHESPREFEEMLNVAKGEPPSFKIQILDPKTGNPTNTLCRYFRLASQSSRWSPLLSGNKKAIEEFTNNGRQIEVMSQSWEGQYFINLLEKADGPGEWLARIRVPRSVTPFKKFDFLPDYVLFLDNKPRGWGLPCSPAVAKMDPEKMREVEELWERSEMSGTVYGTGNTEIFKIHIEANTDFYTPSRYQATGSYTGSF